jgi:hypothetical protein
VISVSARLYIRIRIQKQVGLDDGILLVGTGCFIAGIVLLFLFINQLFEIEAPAFLPDAPIGLNFLEDAFYYQKMSAAALILTWCSLVSVKFCFLCLFKKLVERIRPMVVYWWIATIFNAAVSAYGVTVYIAACPYFNSVRIGKCLPYAEASVSVGDRLLTN